MNDHQLRQLFSKILLGTLGLPTLLVPGCEPGPSRPVSVAPPAPLPISTKTPSLPGPLCATTTNIGPSGLTPARSITFLEAGRFGPGCRLDSVSCETPPSLIILEEADHLHRTPLQTDFFALLRAMAEDKTAAYKSLRLLVTIGAEAAFLETTDHSAFFALSRPIVLEGFSFPQLQSEAALYGLSPDDPGLRELHRLTSGYPQYAQQAMHEAVCSEKTLAEVLTTTDPRGGLFASSLQRLRLYIEREGLRPVLQKLLTTPRFELSPNDYLRLYRKGLVMETSPGEYRLRCPLFDDYFQAWCR